MGFHSTYFWIVLEILNYWGLWHVWHTWEHMDLNTLCCAQIYIKITIWGITRSLYVFVPNNWPYLLSHINVWHSSGMNTYKAIERWVTLPIPMIGTSRMLSPKIQVSKSVRHHIHIALALSKSIRSRSRFKSHLALSFL